MFLFSVFVGTQFFRTEKKLDTKSIGQGFAIPKHF